MHTFKDPIHVKELFVICDAVSFLENLYKTNKTISYLKISKYFLCIYHVCTTVKDRNRLGEILNQKHQSQRKNR